MNLGSVIWNEKLHLSVHSKDFLLICDKAWYAAQGDTSHHWCYPIQYKKSSKRERDYQSCFYLCVGDMVDRNWEIPQQHRVLSSAWVTTTKAYTSDANKKAFLRNQTDCSHCVFTEWKQSTCTMFLHNLFLVYWTCVKILHLAFWTTMVFFVSGYNEIKISLNQHTHTHKNNKNNMANFTEANK